MTLFPWISRAKLRKARQKRQEALRAYYDAKARRDSRTEHHALLSLSRATAAVLALETGRARA